MFQECKEVQHEGESNLAGRETPPCKYSHTISYGYSGVAELCVSSYDRNSYSKNQTSSLIAKMTAMEEMEVVVLMLKKEMRRENL
jgi:hypothetical protein